MALRSKTNKSSRTAFIGLVSNQNCTSAKLFIPHPGFSYPSNCQRPSYSLLLSPLAFQSSTVLLSPAASSPSVPFSTCIESLNIQHTHVGLRELRLELRVSETRIRDFEYPAFFPSPPQSLSSQGETAWYFYLAEIALQRLKSRILYHTYYRYAGAPSSINTDLILNFENQATEW